MLCFRAPPTPNTHTSLKNFQMFHFWEADALGNEDHSSIVFWFLFSSKLTACFPGLRFLPYDIVSVKIGKVRVLLTSPMQGDMAW